MQTGFVPADFIGPIRIEITGITGVDFAAERICPPPGWNATNPGDWKPPAMQDIFLVLSQVEELASPSPSPPPFPYDPHGRPPPSRASGLFVFVLLFCFCCCCCYLCMPDSAGPETTTYTYTARTWHPTDTAQAVRGVELPTMQASAPPMATAVPAVSAPPMAMAVPAVSATPVAVAVPAVSAVPVLRSFLDHEAPPQPGGGPVTWRVLLPQTNPRMEEDYLVGPWGDAIFAAVEFERDNPDCMNDPRYSDGPVGQVIDYLEHCGLSRWRPYAEMTEQRVKEHLGIGGAELPNGPRCEESFLDHQAHEGPHTWRTLLPREVPRIENDYLVGPWGDAIFAAVEFERDNPDARADPRYEGGAVGQVIDYLQPCGQSRFHAQAVMTEHRVKEHIGIDSSSGSSSDEAQPTVTGLMSCTVPAGVYPGQMISVNTPQGPIQVQVPFNKRAGDVFEFAIPATR